MKKVRIFDKTVTKIRVSEIRIREIRVSRIRVMEISVSKIRISSNHCELHGAIFEQNSLSFVTHSLSWSLWFSLEYWGTLSLILWGIVRKFGGNLEEIRLRCTLTVLKKNFFFVKRKKISQTNLQTGISLCLSPITLLITFLCPSTNNNFPEGGCSRDTKLCLFFCTLKHFASGF